MSVWDSSEVFVYETALSVDKTCTNLVKKIYYQKTNLVIYSPNEDRIKMYDFLLWTFKKLEFLPHMIEGEENYKENKIILTSKLSDYLRGFEAIILLDCYTLEPEFSDAKKISYILPQSNTLAVKELSNILSSKTFKTLKYYKEGIDGRWLLC